MKAHTKNRRRVAVVVAALGVLLAACGSSEDPLEIGLRRVALDLAFKDAEKAVPVEPRIIRQEIVTYTGFEEELFEEEPPPRVRVRPFIPPRKPAFVCPEADPNATPLVPAFHVQKGEPKVGTYNRHNTGTVKITTALGAGSLPIPPKSTWDVTSVETLPRIRTIRPEVQEELVPAPVQENETAAPPMVRFTQVKKFGRTSTTYNTYEYDDEFLFLIERKTLTSGTETIFRPTPPIRYVALNETEGTDSEVTFAGIDRERNISMTVQSKIVGREWVDICGEMFDSYRVQFKEQIVNLSGETPTVSGNVGETQFNYWNIQFDNGLNVLREQVDSILEAGVIRLEYKYESVLDKIEPDPLKPDVAGTTPTTSPESEEEEEESTL